MNKWILFGAILVVLGFGGVAAFTSTGNAITGNVVAKTSGEVQDVTLTFENYAYVLTPSSLKLGVPVRMNVDMNTVYGCMRDIRIPAFGVNQYVKEGANIVEFTPTKAGEFQIACSMNMGRGKFKVLESDGSLSSYQEPASAASQATCGAGGGCGGCSGAVR